MKVYGKVDLLNNLVDHFDKLTNSNLELTDESESDWSI